MDSQTDGIEWVMMALFGVGVLVVVFAAWREFTSRPPEDLEEKKGRSRSGEKA